MPLRPVTSALLIALAVIGAAGCKKKQDETRARWLEAPSACPAPATCSGKMEAAAREISVCSALDKNALAAGDVVVVRELGGAHATVGRIAERKGSSFDVEFPDGATLSRDANVIVGRVCRSAN